MYFFDSSLDYLKLIINLLPNRYKHITIRVEYKISSLGQFSFPSFGK